MAESRIQEMKKSLAATVKLLREEGLLLRTSIRSSGLRDSLTRPGLPANVQDVVFRDSDVRAEIIEQIKRQIYIWTKGRSTDMKYGVMASLEQLFNIIQDEDTA